MIRPKGIDEGAVGVEFGPPSLGSGPNHGEHTVIDLCLSPLGHLSACGQGLGLLAESLAHLQERLVLGLLSTGHRVAECVQPGRDLQNLLIGELHNGEQADDREAIRRHARFRGLRLGGLQPDGTHLSPGGALHGES